VIHRTPGGTRDVLPDEMRELRELSAHLRASFEAAGYGEVRTPSVEYEDVLRRGDEGSAGAGFRVFDERGEVLVLRSDMTIPVARMVATRYPDASPPLRFSYFAHAYRAVEPRSGRPREVLQAGVELIGVPAPAGEAEVVGLMLEGLLAAGLGRHRVAIGDGSLYRMLLDELGVPERPRAALLERLTRRDLVGLETTLGGLDLGAAERELLAVLPTLRGGPEVIERARAVVGRSRAPAAEALERLAGCLELLGRRGQSERVIVDLGLARELGYYTGPVFELYDPAVGFAIGGGGRYDELLGRFGRPLPACGIVVDLQRAHVARAEEERLS
jgi:ATP phosphoribosyltransferase regulatory subunit